MIPFVNGNNIIIIKITRCSGYFLPNKPLTQSLVEPPEFQLYEWATLEVAHSRQLTVDLSKISSQRNTALLTPGQTSGYIGVLILAMF